MKPYCVIKINMIKILMTFMNKFCVLRSECNTFPTHPAIISLVQINQEQSLNLIKINILKEAGDY